jgi:hypothetical protein
MAKTFLTNINLKGNQLLNAVIHSASSAPSALAAGQLYFNTGNNTFYYSTGTGTGNWSPVGVQYISSVGSNLSVTDGQLNVDLSGYLTTSDASSTYQTQSGLDSAVSNLGYAKTTDIPSLSGYIQTGDDASLTSLTLTHNGSSGENLQIGDDVWIGDVNLSNTFNVKGVEDSTQGYISFGQNGTTRPGAGKKNYIGSDSTDLTLGSSNDIVLLPTSGYAYIGTQLVDGSNRIATLGDISQGAIQAIDGTQDQISVSKTGETVTISLPSYINIDNGELHLKKTEYWLDGNQYGIVAANGFSNAFSISSVNYPLQLESHTGDIQMLPDSGVVTIGTGYGELHLQKTEYWRDGTQQGIIAAQSDGSIRITGVNNGLQLESNSGDATLTSYNNNVVINSNSGNINLNADGSVIISNGTNLEVGNNAYVKNGIYIGGSDTGTDGYFRIQDSNGDNVFTVSANGTDRNASADIHGTVQFYAPYGTTGNQYGSIFLDGDENLVINANQNNLVLQSDNSNSVYIGSVDANNKVVKFSDLTALQAGLTWKDSVNLLWDDANASLVGLTNTLVIDNHPALTSANNGYRILITNGAHAGIWSYTDDGTSWALDRPGDAIAYQELIGAAVFVEEGTNFGSTAWVQSNHYLTDFTGQAWVQFSGQGTYVGSNSIGLDGNSIYVKLDSDSLNITSSGLKVNYHTDGGLENDSGLYVKTANGVKIDNSGNVTIDYTSLESQLATDGFVQSSDITNVSRKFTADITGNSTDSTFTFTHNFNTKDVVVRVYQTSSGADQWADVEVDIKRSSQNAVQVSFGSAPATGENYGVVIVG